MTHTLTKITAEALKRLELIAAHQTVSPKAEDVKQTQIKEVEKLPLDEYLERTQEFFSKGLSEVCEDEEDGFIDWSVELILYLGKRYCSATQAQLGEVFGYTKGQVKGVVERLDRKIDKDSRKGNYDLIVLLNELRWYLQGESTLGKTEVQNDTFSTT